MWVSSSSSSGLFLFSLWKKKSTSFYKQPKKQQKHNTNKRSKQKSREARDLRIQAANPQTQVANLSNKPTNPMATPWTQATKLTSGKPTNLGGETHKPELKIEPMNPNFPNTNPLAWTKPR